MQYIGIIPHKWCVFEALQTKSPLRRSKLASHYFTKWTSFKKQTHYIAWRINSLIDSRISFTKIVGLVRFVAAPFLSSTLMSSSS